MMSLALAVSCTPGNCTTTRSAPCCWITGSATPSSLTRLCSVVMFCCSACSCTRARGLGLERADQLEVGAVGAFGPLQVGQLVGAAASRACASVCAVAEADRRPRRRRARCRRGGCSCRAAGVRRSPAMRLGLLGQRRLHVDLHQEVHAAAQVEAEVHRQRAQRASASAASATAGSARRCRSGRCGSGLSALPIASLALIWVSVSAKRALTELPSNCTKSALMPAAVSACSTRGTMLRVDLDGGLAAGHLHRRRLAEEVGQRVEHAHHQREPAGSRTSRADSGSCLRTRRRWPTRHLTVPLGSTCTTDERCTCSSTPLATSTCR